MLIAAHRGTFGGNIIQNTISAFENALHQGADILELDVSMSADKNFFVFHSDLEPVLLGTTKKITSMDTEEIRKYRLYNNFNFLSNQRLNTLDEVLEHFKNRCLICIDRGWFCWNEILSYVNKYGAKDQIILKSPVREQLVNAVSEVYVQYMPIIHEVKDIGVVLQNQLHSEFVEVVFSSNKSEISEKRFIEKMLNRSVKLWVNAITLDDKTVLSGGHDDNKSILQNPDIGWGWLIDKGFDIIQTDWPSLLRKYINHRKAKERNLECCFETI